jgi:RsiW-degrading membrane proteinase PrsW (M82 family)
MASRRPTAKFTWRSFLTQKQGAKWRFLLYAALCALIYKYIFVAALPEETAKLFLWVVLIEGVPVDRPRQKAMTFLRGLLKLAEMASKAITQDGK